MAKRGKCQNVHIFKLSIFIAHTYLISHLDFLTSPLFDYVKGGEIIRNEIKTCFTLTLGLRGSNCTDVFVKSYKAILKTITH